MDQRMGYVADGGSRK